MIRSLDDARQWYEAVTKLVGMIDRIARLHGSDDLQARLTGRSYIE